MQAACTPSETASSEDVPSSRYTEQPSTSLTAAFWSRSTALVSATEETRRLCTASTCLVHMTLGRQWSAGLAEASARKPVETLPEVGARVTVAVERRQILLVVLLVKTAAPA